MRKRVPGWFAPALVWVMSPVAASAQVESMEVPLRVVDDRLVASVDIGHGVEVDFIVSTGNAVTVLNQAFLDNHGADGEFWLGDVEVNMDRYATVSNEELNPDGGMIVGIVGANTLNEFDVLFDVPNHRLVLQTVGPEVEWDGVALGQAIDLRVYHGILLTVDLDVVGHPIQALIDTGTGRVVGSPPLGEKLFIPEGEQGSTTLTLGGRDIDVRVHARDLPLFERFDPQGNGFAILGASMTYDCAWSISWAHGELRMCQR